MDINTLLEQLIGQLDEQRAQLFIEEIESMGDNISEDEVIAVYETVSSLDEEQLDELKASTPGKLSSETYKEFERALVAGGLYPGADSKHRAMANKLKGEHDDNLETNLEGEGYQKYMSGKGGKLEDFAARLNAKAKQHVKDPQAIKEDVEQIDELKSSTLGSYIRKATKDKKVNDKKAIGYMNDAKDEMSAKDDFGTGRTRAMFSLMDAGKALGKADDRRRGIRTAYKKLKKGDFQESFDFSADIDAIFEDGEFSAEFKENAKMILEASVKAKANEAIEMYEDALLESLSEMIIEELEAYREEIEDQASGYLNHIVKEYLSENELAIDRGLKVELAESIMEGIKNVLVENDIDIPEEKVNLFEEVLEEKEQIVESVMNEKAEVESLYQAEVEKNISLVEELEMLKKQIIAEELTADLTDLDREKMIMLFEEVDSNDSSDFLRKATLIKETYHKKSKLMPSKELISEDYDDDIAERVEVAPEVRGALAALDRFTNK